MNTDYNALIDHMKDKMHRDEGCGTTAITNDLRRQAGLLAPILDNLQKDATLFHPESYPKRNPAGDGALQHYRP